MRVNQATLSRVVSSAERVRLDPQQASDHIDRLFRAAWALCGSREDAEDLVQETYARALRAEHQFTPGTNLKAWLFRILRNTFLSLYRRQRHNPVPIYLFLVMGQAICFSLFFAVQLIYQVTVVGLDPLAEEHRVRGLADHGLLVGVEFGRG